MRTEVASNKNYNLSITNTVSYLITFNEVSNLDNAFKIVKILMKNIAFITYIVICIIYKSFVSKFRSFQAIELKNFLCFQKKIFSLTRMNLVFNYLTCSTWTVEKLSNSVKALKVLRKLIISPRSSKNSRYIMLI